MKKTLLLTLMMLLFISPAYAEDIIKKGELLTLERSIGIALLHHPSILAAKGTVDVNQARKGQAESAYYPQIDASAGYSRQQPSTISTGTTTVGIQRVQSSHSFEQYNTSISASQMLFDFGRTRAQVRVQKNNVDASRSDLGNTEEQVIFNVKQAYYDSLRAKRNRAVAEDAIRQFEQHLAQAKAFYEVGTRPKFDVTKAEVDLSTARLTRLRADNSLSISLVNLNNAMGVPDAPEYMLEEHVSLPKAVTGIEDAYKTAFGNRPDLLAFASRKKAAEDAVAVAQKGYFPFLTGNAGWTWAGEAGQFATGDGWNAGVTLSIPIFSGFLTKNQVAEARAALSVISANEEALKQNVVLEVQQAYINLKEAAERITVAALTVQQATENLEIASGRYAAGVGNPIEVTDAEVSLSTARFSHNQALYDYVIAYASLEKAMGVR
jgi:TolC family type I secretion outer membrane protein